MKKINLIYEDDYNDVDILLVPDDVADNIDDVVRCFFSWLRVEENASRFMVTTASGHKGLSVDTKEFIWWLNNIWIRNDSEAKVIVQHTSYQNEYPRADF